METDMTDMPLDELKQATLAKVQEMVQDQSGNGLSPRLADLLNFSSHNNLYKIGKKRIIN